MLLNTKPCWLLQLSGGAGAPSPSRDQRPGLNASRYQWFAVTTNRAAIKARLMGLPNEARIVVAGCSIASGLVVLFLIVRRGCDAEGWRDIESSEPRIARLKGYQAYQPALRQAVSDAERC